MYNFYIELRSNLATEVITDEPNDMAYLQL